MSKRFRFLCPQCGTYQEVKGNGPCWKCHVEVALPTDGLILIYRKSSVPAMMEILLNGYDLGCAGENVHYCRWQIVGNGRRRGSNTSGTACTPEIRLVYGLRGVCGCFCCNDGSDAFFRKRATQ